MKIGDLFLQLGIKADTQSIGKINNGFKNMRGMLFEVQAAFGAAVYGLDRFIAGTVSGVAAFENFNAQTGESVDKLLRWQQAAQLSNLSTTAESVTQSIQNLSQNLAAIKMGQGNIAPFQLLGIDVGNKDAFSVLNEVREGIKGLDSGVATNLISQLGLDPSMISVLRLSNEEFDKLSKNVFLSEGGRRAVINTGIAVRELKLRLQALKDQTVAKLAPALQAIIRDFFQWIVKNQSKIISAIGSMINAIKSFAVGVGNALNLASDFVEKLFGMENGLKFLASAFAILALSFRPVLLSMGLLIALLDDFRVWQQGGKSLFGNFYNALKELGKSLSFLKKPFMEFKDAVTQAFSFDSKTEERIGKLGGLLSSLKEVGSSAVAGGILGYLVGGVRGAVVGAGVGGGVDIISQVVKFQKDLMDKFGVKRVDGQIVNNNNFTINESANPRVTAKTIVQELNEAQPALNNGGQ